jgi:hypothetical protein
VHEVGTPISSIQPEDIHRMYKLQWPKVLLNKQFLDVFKGENAFLVEVVKEWWVIIKPS